MRDVTTLIVRVAQALEAAGVPVVFTGGATVPLHVSREVAAHFRGTLDIDCVVQCVTYADYAGMGDDLVAAGFRQDLGAEDWPICRWHLDGVLVDIMPTEADVLGFVNRWYRSAVVDPLLVKLHGIEVPVFRVGYLMASKLDAFRSRGRGDFFASHDVEDVLMLWDGADRRLEEELLSGPAARRAFVVEWIRELVAMAYVEDVVEGHVALGDARRAERLLTRLRAFLHDAGGH